MPAVRTVDIAWLAGLLEGEGSLDLIVTYRRAGWSQEDIMKQVGVGKSTVYRHTKNRVPRYSLRWTKRELRSPVASYALH